MKLLLKIQYDGTDFCGYQVQPNKRTVQGELNRTSAQIYGCDCKVTGCSRTDSGVHALAFYATIEPQDENAPVIPVGSVIRAFNSILPNDISVVDACMVDDSFHARYDVISKEYIYLLYDNKCKNPFLSNRALQLSRPLSDAQLALMNEACRCIVGTHDFTSFMAEGSKIQDATREIYSASVFRYDTIDGLIVFKISGNGFLYNMVRILVGTLIDVAMGKISPEQISQIIHAKNRSLAGKTVAPHGLYLNYVSYPFTGKN